MSIPNPLRFQKIVATGWIAVSESGALSQHEDARVSHPELPDGFPRVWKSPKSCPKQTTPLKVRVTVERIVAERDEEK
jgi:hypothetical protein